MTFTPLVFTDGYLLINATAVSDHLSKVTMTLNWEDLDATTFGQTAKVRRAGLQDGSIAMNFFADYAAANLDSIFWPLYGGAPVPFEFRPTSAARSATNPAYLGNVLPLQAIPIGGDVGKLVEMGITWPTSGPTTRVIV